MFHSPISRRYPLRQSLLPVAVAATLAQPAAAAFPTNGWETAAPESLAMDSKLLAQARDYAVSQGGGAGFITRGGRLVMSWGDPDEQFDLKSTSKSIGVTILGLAIGDGRVSLTDDAIDHYAGFGLPPLQNGSTGWLDQITLEQLATHTAGFDKPGGFIDLLYPTGTTWAYSDGGANWLADVLTIVYGDDLNTILFDHVLTPLGVDASDVSWRPHAYRGGTIEGITRREFGSGIHATVDAMARIGYLYLRQGRWEESQLVPATFVDLVRQPPPSMVGLPVADPTIYPDASQHYGLLWWNNADGTLAAVPADAYWSWGLGEALIVVIPSLDVVVSRAGGPWQEGWSTDYGVLQPFLEPIAEAAYEIVGLQPSPPERRALRLGPIVPSPFRTFAEIRYVVPGPGRVTVSVCDLRGRRVREWTWNDHGGGWAAVRWDGRDEAGRRVASGVYFVRLKAGNEAVTSRTVVLN